MTEGSTRSLAAVWFADIVGYTTLSEEDENAALSLVSQFQTIVENEVPSRSGRIVKYVGDAALVVFESAGSAVESALHVRDAFQEAPLALEYGAGLRIGIHAGEIAIAPDGDVYGDGVNVASRIQGAAAPGQILLSGFAAEGIRHRLDFQVASEGQQKLKGLSRSLDLFAVGWAGGEESPSDNRISRVGARAPGPGKPTDESGVPMEEPTLAVLPPADFSPGGDQAYLVSGLHEEILHQLAQLPGIRLTSRTSSSFMKGVQAGEAAASLGVRYLLESSVRLAQESLLLTVQLIDTFTDEHLWSDRLERSFTVDGLFDLQRVLAQRVAAALRGTLASDLSADLGKPPTRSLEAYNEFLRGLHRQSQFDIEAFWAAADHFERALQTDPEFGRAHAQLARLYAMLNNYGLVTQGELFPKIRAHADLAFRFAPDDPASHLAKVGYVWPMEWNWEEARRLFEEAAALDPDYVDALWGLAEWHGVIAGNTERGLELIRRAFRVDPFSPALHTVRWWILFNGRRFEEGIPDLEAILAVDPNNQASALNLVSSLGLTGRLDEARRLMDEWMEKIPTPRPVTLAPHLVRAGDSDTAWAVLRAAEAQKESGGSVPASGIAAAYAMLGEVEVALDWLERCFEEEGGIYYLRNPDWDNVAFHPRFQALWEKVGLAGEHPARC